MGTSRTTRSQQDHTDAAPLALVRQVALVDASLDGRRAPIVEIVVQLAVASAELQLLEEEGVVL
jgi:hypothetical protein